MRESELEAPGGALRVIDFSGAGPDVLLVHGTGQNALAWLRVVEELADHARCVAVDLRGHGRSTADSSDAESYWRDLAVVADSLHLTRPVLVGHSTGGYAVTAAHAAGLLDGRGLCLVDGFVLDHRDQAPAGSTDPAAMRQQLYDVFGYGWTTDATTMSRHIEDTITSAPGSWLYSDTDPQHLRALLKRCFQPRPDGRMTRRPTLEEIEVVGAADTGATIAPTVDVYNHVTLPTEFLLATRGLYADRQEDLTAVVNADPDHRHLTIIDGHHNLPMTHPHAVANRVRLLLRRS